MFKKIKPQFIVRMDDASPYMDVDKWQKIENILDKFNIKPIVAIIPDNKDEEVIKIDYQDDFWNKAQSWQNKGWSIALHGYDHKFITKNRGIVPRNNYSEFAGAPYDIQSKKIKSGYELLKEKGLNPTIWVAPAHSFDKNTLKAIKEFTDIKIVSDGLALNAFKKLGFNWIPQQVCHVPNRKFGLWTICLHPNNMSDKDFERFEKDISSKYENVIDINNVTYRFSKSMLDYFYIYFYLLRRYIKKVTHG